MQGTLSGKVVVITGSTRGIGRAIASECARRGASVVVNGRGEAAERFAEELRAQGHTATAVVGDVSQADAVEHVFDHALHEHGRIDVWFNNAGLPGGFRPIHEMSPAELLEIIDVNVGGVMLGCRVVLPYFREHGGVLVNMCGRGSRGEVAEFGAPYAATKAAIASLTRSVAAENGDVPNLSVVGMIPGMVATDFYVDMDVSPSLEDKVGNVHVALDAFGASLDEVGAFGARLAALEPGRDTGRILSIITPARTVRGIAKIAAARASGRMKPMR